jgi:hypothetical protein
MPEKTIHSPIPASVPMGKLIQFVARVNIRKMPAHAKAVHDALEARKQAEGKAA